MSMTDSFPFSFILLGQKIPLHSFFEILAFSIGFYLYRKTNRLNSSLDKGKQLLIVLGACLGALLGSRSLAALEHFESLKENFSWLKLTQSKTIVGGLYGGWLGVEITKKYLKIKQSTGDSLVFPLSIGMIIGRLGCATSGVYDGTAGLPSSLPWAFDQGDGIPRHPTALYEIIFLLLLLNFVLWFRKNNKKTPGYFFRLWILSYSIWRLAVDFIKPSVPFFYGLSAIQWACLCAIVYLLNYLRQIRKTKEISL